VQCEDCGADARLVGGIGHVRGTQELIELAVFLHERVDVLREEAVVAHQPNPVHKSMHFSDGCPR